MIVLSKCLNLIIYYQINKQNDKDKETKDLLTEKLRWVTIKSKDL